MRLNPQALQRASMNIESRYQSLKTAFSNFVKAIDQMVEDSKRSHFHLQGISLERVNDDCSVIVSMTGAKIRFKLYSQLKDANTLNGSIVVTRLSHSISDKETKLGELTIKYDGIVDITLENGDDGFLIEHLAEPIVLHFIRDALTMPVSD